MLAFFLFFLLSCQSSEKDDGKSTIYKTGGTIHAERLLDSSLIIHELQFLASDTCEGRKPGSVGHEMAALRILKDFRMAKVDSFDHSLVQLFKATSINGITEGKNIVGLVKGKKYVDLFIVITAHYDHLGKKEDGSIYYGADDNASGVACLLAMAKYYSKNPLPYSLVFVTFDREETGLEGAKYFVQHLPKGINKSNIRLNLNLDMVARSDKNEIYACGLKHYPAFGFAISEIQSKTTVSLLSGHDSGSFRDDWTTQSDHYAFHKENIPFLYIGVEDHADYHRTSDTFDKINYRSYIENCNMIAMLATALATENTQ